MKRSRLTVLLLSAALMVAAVPSLAMADENGTDVSDGETAEVTESAEVKKYDALPQPTLVEAPSVIEGIVYNGSEQELINPGTAENGTIYYNIVGQSDYYWSKSVPVKRAAGTYKVEYYIKGDDGYSDTEKSIIEGIEIGQCELSLPSGSCVTKEYDGKMLSHFRPGDIGWEDVRNILIGNGDTEALITFNLDADHKGVGPDVGTYRDVPISFSGFSGKNYRIVEGGTIDVKITPRDFKVLVVGGIPTEPVIFRDEPVVPELTVTDPYLEKELVEGTDYTVDIKDNDKPGIATVTITRTDNNVNYTSGPIVRTFEIVEASSPFLLNATVEGYRFNLNVYVLSEGVTDLEVNYGGKTLGDNDMTDVKIGGISYKTFTISSVAKEMADSRELTIVADGVTVTDHQELSVADYLKILVRKSEYSLYHDLAAALLYYGAAAQSYFDYNTGNPANEGIDPPPAAPTEDMLPLDGFDRSLLDSYLASNNPDIKYGGMTLTFGEDLSHSLYFYSDKLSVEEVEEFVRRNVLLDPNSIDYSDIQDESDWEEYLLNREDVYINGNYVGVTVRDISILDLYERAYPVVVAGEECGIVSPSDYVIGILRSKPDSKIGKLCKSLDDVIYNAYMCQIQLSEN